MVKGFRVKDFRECRAGWAVQARENKLPLRVSSISPGFVETEFARVAHFGNAEAARQVYSAFSPLKADDVAQAVIWCLAAPDHVDINDILMRPLEQTF
jgi:NADP-dependent 3-hydroxy acid dehydrogenase YdfG